MFDFWWNKRDHFLPRKVESACIRSLLSTHSLEQLNPFSPMVSACIPLSGAGARGIWETWDAIFSSCSLHSNAVTITKWVYAQCRRKVLPKHLCTQVFVGVHLHGHFNASSTKQLSTKPTRLKDVLIGSCQPQYHNNIFIFGHAHTSKFEIVIHSWQPIVFG